MIQILFKRLHDDVELPRRYSDLAVGLDLQCYCKTEQGRPGRVLIPPRTTRNIATGLAAEALSPHYYMQVVSRSGLALKSIFVANAPGIIDPDYRGQLCVLLYNGSFESYYVQHGERIAQLILAPLMLGEPIETATLSKTKRGESGLGSTGKT